MILLYCFLLLDLSFYLHSIPAVVFHLTAGQAVAVVKASGGAVVLRGRGIVAKIAVTPGSAGEVIGHDISGALGSNNISVFHFSKSFLLEVCSSSLFCLNYIKSRGRACRYRRN